MIAIAGDMQVFTFGTVLFSSARSRQILDLLYLLSKFSIIATPTQYKLPQYSSPKPIFHHASLAPTALFFVEIPPTRYYDTFRHTLHPKEALEAGGIRGWSCHLPVLRLKIDLYYRLLARPLRSKIIWTSVPASTCSPNPVSSVCAVTKPGSTSKIVSRLGCAVK